MSECGTLKLFKDYMRISGYMMDGHNPSKIMPNVGTNHQIPVEVS